MLKLYYAPGACSLAPHVALREAGLEFEPIKVDLRAKKLSDGSDYWAINPKGAVPALGFDNGDVLTENAAVLQYIGDQAPSSGLLPQLGDFRRYRVIEWMNFVSTEIHKGYGPLWNPAASDEAKNGARELLAKKFDFVEQELGAGPYLLGDTLTLPDTYLFAVLGWTRIHQIDLSRWANLAAFVQRMSERPAVQAALRAEGLIN